ncbi:MAG: IclR family transcriptional regulator C-terminal domain-containing protein [Sneathiella sp.]
MAQSEKTNKSRTGQVQSLTRALSILNLIAENAPGLNLTGISRALSLAPSTTHRLLTTLQEERYVQYDRDNSRWQIGMQAFVTGNGFLSSRDLVTVARPFMRRVMEESGETVNLAISEGDDVIYMAQVESREMMRVYAKPGNRVPLHCSGVGKAIMMTMTEQDIDRLAALKGLPKLTDKTLCDLHALKAELKTSKDQGFALDNEEHAIGLRCVASVIYDEYSEAIAAVSVSGPAARIPTERLYQLGTSVKKIATDITEALGGKLPI